MNSENRVKLKFWLYLEEQRSLSKAARLDTGEFLPGLIFGWSRGRLELEEVVTGHGTGKCVRISTGGVRGNMVQDTSTFLLPQTNYLC